MVRSRRASQKEKEKEKDGTMRFYFEPEPFTGMTDMLSIQSVGVWGDNYFVIEAESEAEATAKLLNLLEKRVLDGRIRPATEDESKEFEVSQDEAKKSAESAARWIHELNGSKGSGNEESHGKLSSGTEEELIEDLQRVHKLRPDAEPDIDFYRAHGKFADAAWEEHFSPFNRFVGEAGLLLPPGRQALYWAYRLFEILQQHRKEFSKQGMELIRAELRKLDELTKTDRAISEEEKAENGKRTVAALHEEFGVKGSGNEQAT